MRLVLHRSLQTPGIGITEKFGKQQRAGVAFSDRGLQELLDGGKELGIVEAARAAVGEQPFTQACADAVAVPPLLGRRKPHSPRSSRTPAEPRRSR